MKRCSRIGIFGLLAPILVIGMAGCFLFPATPTPTPTPTPTLTPTPDIRLPADKQVKVSFDGITLYADSECKSERLSDNEVVMNQDHCIRFLAENLTDKRISLTLDNSEERDADSLQGFEAHRAQDKNDGGWDVFPDEGPSGRVSRRIILGPGKSGKVSFTSGISEPYRHRWKYVKPKELNDYIKDIVSLVNGPFIGKGMPEVSEGMGTLALVNAISDFLKSPRVDAVNYDHTVDARWCRSSSGHKCDELRWSSPSVAEETVRVRVSRIKEIALITAFGTEATSFIVGLLPIKTIFGFFADAALTATGMIAYKIAEDPPDTNYRELPQVVPLDTEDLDKEPDSIGKEFAKVTAEILALQEAHFTAINRADGASIDREHGFEAMQLQEASKFALRISAKYAELRNLASEIVADLDEEDVRKHQEEITRSNAIPDQMKIWGVFADRNDLLQMDEDTLEPLNNAKVDRSVDARSLLRTLPALLGVTSETFDQLAVEETKIADTIEQNPPTPVRPLVPNVLMESREEAVQIIRKNGFRVGQITPKVSSQQKGIVLEQIPGPWEKLPANTSVDLVVSAGRPQVRPVSRLTMDGDVAQQNSMKNLLVAPGEQKTLVFSAAGSSDADGKITGYSWRIDGQNRSTSQEFNVALGPGTHQVQLTVTDNDGLQDSVQATVIITEQQSPSARLTASSGGASVPEGKTLQLKTAPGVLLSVSFSAARSTDPDGSIRAYQWDINRALRSRSQSFNVTLGPGTHEVILTVTDNDGLQASVQATVIITEQQSPSARLTAGSGGASVPEGKTLQLKTAPGVSLSVNFSAARSFDPDGKIAGYSWRIDGQNHSASQSFNHPLGPGTHEVVLTVTDTDGLQDSVRATVNITEQQSPSARLTASSGRAGISEGQTLPLKMAPGDPRTVSFSAARSFDPDGSIRAYQWLINRTLRSSSQSFNVTLERGIHQVVLTVTDNDGLQASVQATVIITELQSPSARLTASSGRASISEGQTLHLKMAPGGLTTVSFSAAGSTDPDGSIRTYQWNINRTLRSTSQSFNVRLGRGTHQVVLTVTDNDGLQASVQATVIITEQQSPSARLTASSRGASISEGQTLSLKMAPGDSRTISFSAAGSSDPDGKITGYSWRIDGQTLSTSSSYNVTLGQGTHVMQLIVTDNDGLKDSVLATVAIIEATLSVSPRTVTLMQGDSTTLTATLRDLGYQVLISKVTWSSGNVKVATVNASTGLVTAVGAGRATITASTPEDISASAVITVTQGLSTITFQGDGAPFFDSRVQEAFLIAVPWSGYMNTFFPSRDIPVVVDIINPITNDARDQEYDLGKAKRLLAEAGYPDGLRVFWYIHQTDSIPDLAGRVEANLAFIGVELVRIMELSTFRAATLIGETTLGLFGDVE